MPSLNTRLQVLVALCCAAVLACPPGLLADGSLINLREEVAGSPDGDGEPEPPKQKRKRRRRDDFDCDDDDGESLLGVLLKPVFVAGVAAATSPFWGPPKAVGDDFTFDTSFTSHPYDGPGGWLDLEGRATQKPWLVRLSGEYGDGFDGHQRIGGKLRLDTTWRLGVDASWDYRREDLSRGRHDRLWTGDCNAIFRFAQSEHLAMRTGFGVNWLNSDTVDDIGFNFTYGGDWFPADPWVISGEIDWGRLGDAGLFHARGTVGVQIENAEIYIGYDYFDVDSVTLDGIVAGIGLWF